MIRACIVHGMTEHGGAVMDSMRFVSSCGSLISALMALLEVGVAASNRSVFERMLRPVSPVLRTLKFQETAGSDCSFLLLKGASSSLLSGCRRRSAAG